MRKIYVLACLSALFLNTSCDNKENIQEIVTEAGAPLFDGMGDHTHPITTKNEYVQRYFDQGLTLSLIHI